MRKRIPSSLLLVQKGTVPIRAKHPSGRSGEWGPSPFSLLVLIFTLAWLGGLAVAQPAIASADAIDAEIARLKQAGFPLVDFHIHLKGGLTIEEAVALSRQTGIRYGIAANCGLNFPITDDRGIERYINSLKGQPVFIGMQAEGREWPQLFSKEAIAKFDYVFTDAMTIVDHRGRRARLWVKDEVDIPDPQAFMELLVRTIENILGNEPIDIYVNPTYLPDVLAKQYDDLWTPERVRRVIAAAAANGVAIEISNRLRLPKPAFIKQAQRAGIKFTFGTNNVDHNLGRCGIWSANDPGVWADAARHVDAQTRWPKAGAVAQENVGCV